MRRRISCEDSACPLRRGMQELHIVLLFRLSPKWGMNPDNSESDSRRSPIVQPISSKVVDGTVGTP
jgi:hypothetical protein